MKGRLLTLLLTFAFIVPISVNAKTQVIHDWTTPQDEETANDPIFGVAYKYSYKGSAADRWNPSNYFSSGVGSVTVEAYAELLSIGDEENVISWIKATSDQGRVSPPSKDGVDDDNIERDWKGRRYNHDSKRVYAPDADIYADAVTSYKAHPIAAYSSNKLIPHLLLPWDERLERNFYHSSWASAWASDENSPSDLPEFNPFATGDLDTTSRSKVNAQVILVSYSTPRCTGSSEHPPGPCPGH